MLIRTCEGVSDSDSDSDRPVIPAVHSLQLAGQGCGCPRARRVRVRALRATACEGHVARTARPRHESGRPGPRNWCADALPGSRQRPAPSARSCLLRAMGQVLEPLELGLAVLVWLLASCVGGRVAWCSRRIRHRHRHGGLAVLRPLIFSWLRTLTCQGSS
jgi:hypothetical protein